MKTNVFFATPKNENDLEWMLVQNKIDSLKKNVAQSNYHIYPFNPNFITDYKGYMLGMSIEEIDRLHRFRATGKFVNSKEEFQKITKISTELLNEISPYFKFPDWITSNKVSTKEAVSFQEKKVKIIPKELNQATKEDFMEVFGIGDKISDIILKEKEKLGQFATIEQLQFIWGISPEVYEECKRRFYVQSNANLKKIFINTASVKELSKFPYFNYAFSKEIVTYRSMNGTFSSIDDLAKINNCPLEKLKIIALYLEF